MFLPPSKSRFNFRDHYDETFSTLKFADRAKSVFVKIKPNEIIANDDNMLNKLINEINSLKQILSIRKKRGQIADIEEQFFKLKEENEKLKQFVKTNQNIENLIEENKFLKLELQKIKFEIQSDEFKIEEKYKIKSDFSNFTPKITNQNVSENKFINAGFNIMMNNKSIKKVNNTNLETEFTSSKEMNEINYKNRRLRYLEDLEKKNGMKIIKEIQRIENERIKRNEEKVKKNNEISLQKKKIDDHINRINYLYKNNSKIFSEYLSESFIRNPSSELFDNRNKKK